jgi:hypothetical protein
MSRDYFMESEIVFVEAETNDRYIVRKDRNNVLKSHVIVDSLTVESIFENKELKVAIADKQQQLLRKNFKCMKERLELANEFLNDVSLEYESKLKAVDEALDEYDEAKFLKLVNELYGGVVDGV